MKIITLAENLVTSGGFYAEHGLSMFIQTDNRKILFDTGQSDVFIKNAGKLGIDLSEIDVLVLSHGHYDHTGGLNEFVKINSKATVLAKKDIFVPKFSGKTRFIGLEYNEKLARRISFVDSLSQIDDDLFVCPEIKITYPEDTNFRMLYKREGVPFYPDDFTDELFLTIRGKEKISIITACSHRGISNICSAAVNCFKLPVKMIIGGFHMKDCEIAQYNHIVKYLRNLKPEIIGTCHCTGVEGYARLKNDLDGKVFYNFTGNEINIM